MFTLEGTPFGEIVGTFGPDEMVRVVSATDSHFFDRDTMRWFGTRNLEMVGSYVMIAVDTKAPEGYPRYWARVFRVDGSSEKIAEAHTRRGIRSAATKAVRALVAGTYEVQS